MEHRKRNGTLESRGLTKNGVPFGPWVYYHSDGTTVKAAGTYDEKGQFIGLWKWFSADGKVRQEGSFLEGKQHGRWRRYYANTTQLVDDGHYDHGKKVGPWVYYNKDGSVKRRQNYRP